MNFYINNSLEAQERWNTIQKDYQSIAVESNSILEGHKWQNIITIKGIITSSAFKSLLLKTVSKIVFSFGFAFLFKSVQEDFTILRNSKQIQQKRIYIPQNLPAEEMDKIKQIFFPLNTPPSKMESVEILSTKNQARQADLSIPSSFSNRDLIQNPDKSDPNIPIATTIREEKNSFSLEQLEINSIENSKKPIDGLPKSTLPHQLPSFSEEECQDQKNNFSQDPQTNPVIVEDALTEKSNKISLVTSITVPRLSLGLNEDNIEEGLVVNSLNEEQKQVMKSIIQNWKIRNDQSATKWDHQDLAKVLNISQLELENLFKRLQFLSKETSTELMDWLFGTINRHISNPSTQHYFELQNLNLDWLFNANSLFAFGDERFKGKKAKENWNLDELSLYFAVDKSSLKSYLNGELDSLPENFTNKDIQKLIDIGTISSIKFKKLERTQTKSIRFASIGKDAYLYLR